MIRNRFHFHRKVSTVRTVVVLLWLLVSTTGFSKDVLPGYWLGVELSNNLGKKLEYSVSLEDRRTLGLIQDKWLMEGNVLYQPVKRLEVGLGYRLTLQQTVGEDLYSGRLHADLRFKQKMGRWQFKSRTRCQVSNPGSNKLLSYETGYYLRQKAEVQYNIRKCPVTPKVSCEAYYQMNAPRDEAWDKFRYSLEADIKINQVLSVVLFTMLEQELHKNYHTGIVGCTAVVDL